jgi:polyphosphate kinase 2 (PPK2 family)
MADLKDKQTKNAKKQGECPVKVKLLEGTAMKNMNKKEKKDRCAVWIKSATLDYEVELKTMQIELMKLQKHMKASGMRILAIFEGREAELSSASPPFSTPATLGSSLFQSPVTKR